MRTGKFCAFTGHRRIAKDELPRVKNALTEAIESLIQRGFYSYLCGGALGWDMECGFAVLDFKAKHDYVKLVMILPCREQDKNWNEKDKATYKQLLAAADEIIYVSEEYAPDCMKRRNAELIRRADFCLAYMKHMRSGTSQTVRMAREKGIPVYNFADENAAMP